MEANDHHNFPTNQFEIEGVHQHSNDCKSIFTLAKSRFLHLCLLHFVNSVPQIDIKSLYKRFRKLDQKDKVYLKFHEFSSVQELPSIPVSEELLSNGLHFKDFATIIRESKISASDHHIIDILDNGKHDSAESLEEHFEAFGLSHTKSLSDGLPYKDHVIDIREECSRSDFSESWQVTESGPSAGLLEEHYVSMGLLQAKSPFNDLSNKDYHIIDIPDGEHPEAGDFQSAKDCIKFTLS